MSDIVQTILQRFIAALKQQSLLRVKTLKLLTQRLDDRDLEVYTAASRFVMLKKGASKRDRSRVK